MEATPTSNQKLEIEIVYTCEKKKAIDEIVKSNWKIMLETNDRELQIADALYQLIEERTGINQSLEDTEDGSLCDLELSIFERFWRLPDEERMKKSDTYCRLVSLVFQRDLETLVKELLDEIEHK